jgi:hypothetical protein
MHICRVGQNHTFLGIYGVYTVFFGREITIYTVIYGMYIRFWPTQHIWVWVVCSWTAGISGVCVFVCVCV